MKRILVPVDHMFNALVSLNVNGEQAADIMALFTVIDAGHFDALVMPDLSFNTNNHLSREDVLITLFAFWQCVVGITDSRSEYERQALGAIRSLYFVATNFGHEALAAYISVWWQQTGELHGSTSVELWG